MSSKLVTVAVSGLVIGAACIIAAAMVGGPELRNRDWNFGDWSGESCDITLANKTGTRTLDWHAGDDIAVNLPANVSYRRGQGEQIVIEGDAALISHVAIDDNDLVMDCRPRNARGQRLTITLPGQEFRRFAVNGSASMVLENLDQPELRIDISGSGDVTASGRAERLNFDVAGSGKVTLKTEPKSIDTRIAGSGRIIHPDGTVTRSNGLSRRSRNRDDI